MTGSLLASSVGLLLGSVREEPPSSFLSRHSGILCRMMQLLMLWTVLVHVLLALASSGSSAGGVLHDLLGLLTVKLEETNSVG